MKMQSQQPCFMSVKKWIACVQEAGHLLCVMVVDTLEISTTAPLMDMGALAMRDGSRYIGDFHNGAADGYGVNIYSLSIL